MTEEQDLIGLLVDKIEYQIKINKDNLKDAKHNIKKLEKTKTDLLETGIDDYVFDDKISHMMDRRIRLEKRINVLKKIKYRLVISEKMLNSLK